MVTPRAPTSARGVHLSTQPVTSARTFDVGPEGTVRPDLAATHHGFEAPLSGLYDVGSDLEGLDALSRAYNLPDYQPVVPGARGGASGDADLERMLDEYGYSGALRDRARLTDPVALRPVAPGPGGFAMGGSV